MVHGDVIGVLLVQDRVSEMDGLLVYCISDAGSCELDLMLTRIERFACFEVVCFSGSQEALIVASEGVARIKKQIAVEMLAFCSCLLAK